MNALRFFLTSSAMALLAACTTPLTPLDPLPDPFQPEESPGPTYTTTTTATLTPAPGRTFGNLQAASTGNEAAIVYTESGDEDSQGVVQSRVVLQRLNGKGATSGPPVELAIVDVKGYERPALAIATDGVRYLACWQLESSIACKGVPVGEGPAFPALSVKGAWPSLAYGAGTFVLAYSAPEKVSIVRVASNGSAVGSPDSFATGEGSNSRTFLTATDSGFALLDADLEWKSNVRLHRLDSDLAPLAPPLVLGLHIWGRVALAANETNVVVGLAKPYGGEVFTVEGGSVTHIYEFSAGGKLGMNVTLLANEASFDMLSTYDDDSGLRYRTLQDDEVVTSEEALLTGQDFDSSALAPLRLGGALFLAATDPSPSKEMMVVRVQLP